MNFQKRLINLHPFRQKARELTVIRENEPLCQEVASKRDDLAQA